MNKSAKTKHVQRRQQRDYLSVEIEGKYHNVHDLVAQAFLPPPTDPRATRVIHIDGNRYNNCASNLKWATPEEERLHNIANAHVRSFIPPLSSADLAQEEWTPVK